MQQILLDSLEKLIKNSSSNEKLAALCKKHEQKLHFIPLKYRIFGGILQSMNIQFGKTILAVPTRRLPRRG